MQQMCDSKSDNGAQRNAFSAGEECCGGVEGSVCDAKRMMVISIAVTLEKIHDVAGTEAVKELIGILQHDQFSLKMFRDAIKSRDDCKKITDDFIKQCKEL